jgi:hypothetical protein
MTIITGIDPGQTGAIVGEGPDGVHVVRASSYYAGKRIVPSLLVAALRRVQSECGGGDVAVVTETQQAFKAQGLSSTFTTGINYGIILATVEVLGFVLYDLNSQKWRPLAGIVVPAVKMAKFSEPRPSTMRMDAELLAEWKKRKAAHARRLKVAKSKAAKDATIAEVSRRLPAVDLMPGRCTTAQDGIADAAGMVLAGRVLVG